MDHIITDLRNELKSNSDDSLIAGSQYFFKEPIKCYGIKSTTLTRISREYYNKVNSLPKTEIFGLCGQLWQSGYIEESFLACNWSYNIHKMYEEDDFELFADWINKYVTNWATCDTFCNHTVGKFIEMYPDYISRLKEFTKSKNRWMRRAAAVSLIVPARKGMFLNDIFEIADLLIYDKDDLVQKGYGWALKVSSQTHQKAVFEYVVSKKAIMPRTALRYAIEKMPKELKFKAMQK
jgi:3-methyladenine DNA glycosylase AlkD